MKFDGSSIFPEQWFHRDNTLPLGLFYIYCASCCLEAAVASEAAMASEATKTAVRGNIHMDTRVIKVADFKPEVI